jgi:TRAP-type C4-dicarboxylate transport system permease small subunit
MKFLALQIPAANGNPIQINGVGGMPEGGPNSLASIVGLGLNLLLLAALFLSLFYLIWGGFNWLMSEGEKQRISQAREKVVYAIIGLAVVFMSFLIINAFYWFFLGNKANPLIYGY